MARITEVSTREALVPAQQRVYDEIVDRRGAVRGPFLVLLHRPEVASAAAKLGAYLRFDCRLSLDVREAVMATVAWELDCEYEWSTHRDAAVDAGVPGETMAALERGKVESIPGKVGLAIRFVVTLLRSHHVPDPLFEDARRVWSDAELVDLVSLAGYYSLISMTINVFQQPRATV